MSEHRTTDALRIEGGGNNFGIATEFVLKTHPQGTGGNRGNVYVSSFDFHAAIIHGTCF
jgi:hypothetical protein